MQQTVAMSCGVMARQLAKKQANLGMSVEIEPMEAKSAEALPAGTGWQFEPKWDGFRCIAFRSGGRVDLRSKSGKPLDRYFPELIAFLARLPVDRFVIDGELVVEIDGGWPLTLSRHGFIQPKAEFASCPTRHRRGLWPSICS
jgi:ATP-dependent DNA ligase